MALEQSKWRPILASSPKARTTEIRFAQNEIQLSFFDVLELLVHNSTFQDFFNAMLASLQYTAFRWECPPLTKDSFQRAFECVAIEDSKLSPNADPSSFRKQFDLLVADDGIVSFPNLGHDAVLVVPTPVGDYGAYCHLGAFVRNAPEAQKRALWRIAAQSVVKRIRDRPVWLNTAGAGVPWLHVRLDDRPKYYHHVPYKTVN